MLTSRGSGLLGAAIALWVASQTFGTPELQVAAVAALVLVGLGLLWVWVTSTQLTVDRLVQPTKLPFGGRGQAAVTITNRGARPTARLRLHDRVPASLATPPETSLPPLAPGERVDLRYTLIAEQRGVAQLGPVTAEFSDPFGLTTRTRELPGSVEVTVRPRVVPLERGLPLGGMSGGTGEGRPRPQPGGGDLAEVREYVQGDALRTVHWPSTAHRGKLMVRREEGPQDPRATVILDLRAHHHRGSGPTASLETAVSAAASVIVHLADRRQAVALVDRSVTGNPPALPAEPWLDHLAEVDAHDEELRAILSPLSAGGAVGSTVVAIVAAPTGPDLTTLVRLGRSASTRVALLVDPARHAGATTDDPATAAGALRLQAAGWRVTTLTSGAELADRWRDVLHLRRTGVGA